MLAWAFLEAKRLVIFVIGATLLAIGVVMIFTPGPGWLVILGGLAVLGTEFVWARRLLKRLKQSEARIAGTINQTIFARKAAK